MKHLSTLIAFSATILMLMPGCKKQQDTQPEKTALYDFFYAGIMREGEPIGFSVKSPGIAECLWDFGDGTTANYVNTTHAYTHSGVYDVTVTVNGDVAHKASKSISVSPNLFPSYLASGMKTWHGHYTMSSASLHSSYDLPDSSFAVMYVDSLSVRVFNTILPYDKNSSAGDVSVYSYSPDAMTGFKLSYNTKSGSTTFKIISSPPDSYAEIAYTTP